MLLLTLLQGTALLQDRAALESQLEGLLRVARAHDAGKESYAQSVATELFEDYLLVEERFAANKDATEQEVIDSMRKASHRTAVSSSKGEYNFWWWCPSFQECCKAGFQNADPSAGPSINL